MVEGPHIPRLSLHQSLEAVPGLQQASRGQLVELLAPGLQDEVRGQAGQGVTHPVAVAMTAFTLRREGEGEREGGREGRRQGVREGGRQGGSERGREAGRE